MKPAAGDAPLQKHPGRRVFRRTGRGRDLVVSSQSAAPLLDVLLLVNGTRDVDEIGRLACISRQEELIAVFRDLVARELIEPVPPAVDQA